MPAHKHQPFAIPIRPNSYEPKNNGEYLCWKQVDGRAPRADRLLSGWGHWGVSVKELFVERFPDLKRTKLRAHRRRQESESAEEQTGAGCRLQGTCMSLNQSQFWVGASAQHMTSQILAHKGRYIKARSGLRLINTRLAEHAWLPMGIYQ